MYVLFRGLLVAGWLKFLIASDLLEICARYWDLHFFAYVVYVVAVKKQSSSVSVPLTSSFLDSPQHLTTWYISTFLDILGFMKKDAVAFSSFYRFMTVLPRFFSMLLKSAAKWPKILSVQENKVSGQNMLK